jgi:hypothetical protein
LKQKNYNFFIQLINKKEAINLLSSFDDEQSSLEEYEMLIKKEKQIQKRKKLPIIFKFSESINENDQNHIFELKNITTSKSQEKISFNLLGFNKALLELANEYKPEFIDFFINNNSGLQSCLLTMKKKTVNSLKINLNIKK